MDSTNIADFLECSICFEQLDEKSRVLPCQHTFCLDCLAIIVETKGHLQCPECRSDFPNLQISSLPRNVLLVRILEGLKSSRCGSRRGSADGNLSSQNLKQQKSRDSSNRLSAKLKCEALLSQPCARGLHSFSSNEEGDLSFCKGDVISLVHDIDDNWFEGIFKGKRGSIPKNFVEIILPLPKIDDDSIETPFARASYSYESKGETELLSFKTGDIIGVIKKVDEKWLEGILGGQYGIFPLNFVKVNKACQTLLSCSSSSSSSASSSSDEENADKQKNKKTRAKKSIKTSSSPWVKREDQACSSTSTTGESTSSNSSSGSATASSSGSTTASSSSSTTASSSGSTTTVPAPKRHTIHVENPIEQRRESRRALNLSDDVDQPRPRLRTRSQGRRGSDTPPQDPRAVLLNRALRLSNEQLNPAFAGSLPIPLPSPGAVFTTSLSNRPNATAASSPTNGHPTLGLGEIYVALFTYSPAQDDELALIQGDQYCVVEKHLDGWYKGYHIRSRQTGVFPGNYVKPKSQVTHQMLRSINSNPQMSNIGYGSNPSSPVANNNADSVFSFPTTRNDSESSTSPLAGATACATIRPNGENSSPGRSGMASIFKKLKKSKTSKRNSRSTPTEPSIPPPVVPSPVTQPTLAPPSYYHSSMPGPAHHRLSRPSPIVPAEPPPPYTMVADPTPSSNIIETVLVPGGEKFRAIHPFPSTRENELSLHVNDILCVTQKRFDGWYQGKSERTGLSGIFPSTFVEAYES